MFSESLKGVVTKNFVPHSVFAPPNKLHSVHHCSYSISNIDDFETLVKLESQSDNKNELANLEFSTPYTELQTEKATTGNKTISESSK